MAQSKMFNCSDAVFRNSNWGLTKFDVKTFFYRWDIPYFLTLPKITGECCQKLIPTDKQSATCWYLHVYPRGKEANVSDYVSVYLWSEYVVNAQYAIELRDSSNNVLIRKCCEYARFTKNLEKGDATCIRRDTLQKALEKSIDETLTITCTINEFTDIRDEVGPSGRPMQKPKDAHSTNLLKTLLTNPVYTDFTINVKRRQFKVHKAVLYTCSPVFAKMLTTEMKEKVKNEASVDDVDPEVFEKILEFMYTGSVATINANAMDLVPVAHKYELQGLLEQCEAALCSQISTDLAVKLLLLSNLYALEYLKTGTVKYIKANLSGVSKTSQWKTHVEKDPALLMMLLMP